MDVFISLFEVLYFNHIDLARGHVKRRLQLMSTFSV